MGDSNNGHQRGKINLDNLSWLFSTIGHDFHFSQNYSLSFKFFEFKRKGIVVGKVEVMANCRKKPRQIVQVNFTPLVAVVTVSHLCSVNFTEHQYLLD